ncbi:MAG: hypothetical protein WC492_03540 [Candidatus Micrarchaeia archaeon]
MAQICIVCSKETHGIPVEDTQVIKAIRAIKQRFAIASNNKLVVCAESMEEYKKRRKSFEGKMLFHSVAGLFLVVVSILLPLFGGRFEIIGFFMVLLLAIFLVGLALLSYVPPLEKSALAAEEAKEQAQKQAQQNQSAQSQTSGKGFLETLTNKISNPQNQGLSQSQNQSQSQKGLYGVSSKYPSRAAQKSNPPQKNKPTQGGKKVK